MEQDAINYVLSHISCAHGNLVVASQSRVTIENVSGIEFGRFGRYRIF